MERWRKVLMVIHSMKMGIGRTPPAGATDDQIGLSPMLNEEVGGFARLGQTAM